MSGDGRPFANHNIMNKDQDIMSMEKAEVDRLVKNGFSFSVEYDIERRNWYGRKVREHKVESFHIEEPTLGTLDRMCREFVKMAEVDQSKVKGSDMADVYKWAADYSRSACRAIAYGVIGREYGAVVSSDGFKSVDGLERRVDELADLFLATMKPNDLKTATMYVLASMNIGDFLASIVLMSGQRTSKPDTVEGKR